MRGVDSDSPTILRLIFDVLRRRDPRNGVVGQGNMLGDDYYAIVPLALPFGSLMDRNS